MYSMAVCRDMEWGLVYSMAVCRDMEWGSVQHGCV